MDDLAMIAVGAVILPAVIMDFMTAKVRNLYVLAGYGLGILYLWYVGAGFGEFIIRVLYPVIIMYPLFMIRALGAGDIKLFSVISVFCPYKVLLCMIIESFLAAGVIGAFVLIRGILRKEEGKRHYIHYTFCILLAFGWEIAKEYVI